MQATCVLSCTGTVVCQVQELSSICRDLAVCTGCCISSSCYEMINDLAHVVCRRPEDAKERDRRSERSTDRRREPERSSRGPSHGRERDVRERERDRDPRASGRDIESRTRRPDGGRDRGVRGPSRQAFSLAYGPDSTLVSSCLALSACTMRH